MSVAELSKVELIKLDCLAVIRARCGQAPTTVVQPHLLCQRDRRGGGGGHSWMTSNLKKGTTSLG